jgi:hypothetical protein
LAVVLVDAKGVERGRTKTDGDGQFTLEPLPPGTYRLVCGKPTPPTKGDAEVVVSAGATAEPTIAMLRTLR